MQRYDNNIGVKWLLAGVFLLIALLIASCHKEEVEITPKSDKVTITFSAKLPKVSGGLKTYALYDTEEIELKDVDVLVYIADDSDWKFHYRTVGKIGPMTPNGNGGGTAEIKVKLWKTQVNSRLVILANAREQLNVYPFVAGEPLTILDENLVYKLGVGERWLANLDEATDDYLPLPMWAKHDIDDGITGDMTIGTNLLRSLARVDIVADDVAVTANFTLDSVYVYNSNRNGLIIPDTVSLQTGNPSLPTSVLENDGHARALAYKIANNKSEGEIYLFEAEAGDNEAIPSDPNATALIIKGSFTTNPGSSYYYRIDFKDASNHLIPLLRNRRYVINIISATFDIGKTHYESRYAAFDEAALLISYGGSQGIKPIGSEQYSRPSITHADIVPKGTGGISYTITTIDENE